jgi:flagellar biosynthesis protein FlhB
VADEVDQESKTEDPTPRRREEARRQGQVPFSAELVGSLVLVVGVVGLIYLGPAVWTAMSDMFRQDLRTLYQPEFGTAEARERLTRSAIQMLVALLPFFAVLLLVGVVASVAQVGLQLNGEKLSLDFDKLNPANGLKKLFSVAALVRGGLMLLKVAALATVAYVVLEPRVGVITSLSRGRLAWASAASWAIVLRLAIYLTAAVALVAVLDYIYQRYRFEQSLRMTKEEVKREMKEEEGDPQIKARIRQIARERSRRKMLTEVPKATVVVTNPQHYAVALRYAPDRGDAAPVVVAKGTGAFAKRIAEKARAHGIAVLERPPLARALHSLKEGQPIPGPLFRAVAEVIAFVYRLRGVGQTA